MNDPEINEPIAEVADGFEKNFSDDASGNDTGAAKDYLKPGRWWLASTGAPLAAGTFGPIASFLSICALVQPWRAYIPPGNNEAQTNDIPDPRWLLAINAISLAFALIANGALLLNMARRLSLKVAQPIIIIGWFLSGIMLICLVIAASLRSIGFRLSPPERHTLTQGFYYGLYASILYCIVALFMVFTVIGAVRGHYQKEFTLTTAQRTLMLQTIGFLMYLLLGALVFSRVEKWRYLDAVYWADFTLLTIGIGSPFTPQTVLGKALLFPYGIGGILTIGLVIGSIRSLVLERGKEKIQARFVEKKREKSVKSIDLENHTIKTSWFRRFHFSDNKLNEPQRREQEFLVMRRIQDEAEYREKWMNLIVSSTATLILWLVGAVVFYLAERNAQGWSYYEAVYFAYTSLLTIGYGDVQPVSNSGKPFFVLWTLMAVPTLTILISHMGHTIIKSVAHFTIWAGELTILPGDSPAKHKVHHFFVPIFKGIKVNPKEFTGANQPPGFLPQEDKEPARTREDEETDEKLNEQDELRNHFLDRFAKHIAEDEVFTNSNHQSGRHPQSSLDTNARDTYNYVYVLIKELVVIMTDIAANPSKKYSYQDWAWYLKLIGQDEADDSLHRQPQTRSSDANMPANEIGKADGEEKEQVWSWLGVRSPLMSDKSESEWIAARLSSRLEKELDCLRNGRKGPPVPVSYSDTFERLKTK